MWFKDSHVSLAIDRILGDTIFDQLQKCNFYDNPNEATNWGQSNNKLVIYILGIAEALFSLIWAIVDTFHQTLFFKSNHPGTLKYHSYLYDAQWWFKNLSLKHSSWLFLCSNGQELWLLLALLWNLLSLLMFFNRQIIICNYLEQQEMVLCVGDSQFSLLAFISVLITDIRTRTLKSLWLTQT